MPRSRVRLRAGLLLAATAIAASLALPLSASAHPLGNLTINHFAAIHVAPSTIVLDVVIDYAEIPAFQERQRLDTDGDGSVGDAELEAERLVACGQLAPELELRVGGQARELRTWAAGVSLPPGLGGLPTLRVVCQYEATLDAPIAGPTEIAFADLSDRERIGWREIVVVGNGTRIEGEVDSESVSQRLTSYPEELLSRPLTVGSVAFTASPAGAPRPYPAPSDASLLPGAVAPTVGGGGPTGSSDPPTGSPPPSRPAAAVPGGVPDDIAALIGVEDLSPIAILGTLLVAAGLGAVHALSPGHGKTVMAAYLVGSRGSARHALGLGLTVTISHTAGVFALAAITLVASTQFPPDRLYPVLQLVSGLLVVAIGGWLLWGQVRAWRERRANTMHNHADQDHHDHADHDHAEDHGHAHANHEHDHDEHDHEPHEHSHGGIRHNHLPSPGSTLSWRSLVSLGLAGGLVPSISALAILLGSLQAQRPAYGLVLVIAFGAGMAIVLAGIGLALVYASRAVERVSLGSRFDRLWMGLPIATAVVVIVAGVYLASQSFALVF